MNFEFTIDRISKRYGTQILFSDLSFGISSGKTITITGNNGSGKSTLLKILCNLIKPDKGNIYLEINSLKIEKTEFYRYIGFVSPYLNLYDELTISEHILFLSKIRKEIVKDELIKYLTQAFKLENETKIVKQFSSGMKQKLKFILAIIFEPKILILDEPYSNLDNSAIEFLDNFLTEFKFSNALIIASNDIKEQKTSDLEIKL